jgi:hypothetical protein
MATGQPVYIEIDQHTDEHRRGGPFGDEGRTTNTRDLRTCKSEWRSNRETDDSAGRRLQFTYDRLMLETQTFFGQVKFDTDVDLPDPEHALGSIFGLLLGKSMTLNLAPDLSAGSCEGMKTIYNAAEEVAVDMFMLAQLTDRLTDESARFLWGDALFVLHAVTPVETDDVRTRTLHHEDIYMGRLKYTYDIMPYAARAGDAEIKVLYRANIRSVPGGTPPSRLFGMLITDVKGSLEGEALYDAARGAFTRMDETIRLDIKGLADGAKPGTTDDLSGTRTIKKTVRHMTPEERMAQRNAGAAARNESKPAMSEE